MNLVKLTLLVALVAIGYGVYTLFFAQQAVGFANTMRNIVIGKSNVTFARNDNGVAHLWVDNQVWYFLCFYIFSRWTCCEDLVSVILCFTIFGKVMCTIWIVDFKC